MTSIRTILSVVTVQGLYIQQLDVKIAFLHGDLEDKIYMYQPKGYEVKQKEDFVYKLKKRLYGIKKYPRKWYLNFDKFMGDQKFKRCQSNHYVYFKKIDNANFLILWFFIDDILILISNKQYIDILKKRLDSFFSMKDLGDTK